MELKNEQEVAVPELADTGDVSQDAPVIEVREASESNNVIKPAEQAVDIAAKQFELYMPIFKNGIKRLTRKQLARLVSALVEYPLNNKAYKHNEKFEKDTFLIGHQLLESKYMMILFTMMESQQMTQALEKAAQGSAEVEEVSSQQTQDEGVSNGEKA